MDKVIMTGCDLHERNLLVKAAAGKEAALKRTFRNSPAGREAMRRWIQGLAGKAGARRIVFTCEAAQHGFGLFDELTRAGIEAHVLAPTRLPVTPKARRTKTESGAARLPPSP